MNKIAVLKDVAYGAKVGGGTITGYNEADQLVEGAIAFLNDKGEIITLGNAATATPDSKYFSIIAKRSADTILVPQVPRIGLIDVNRVDYRAATRQIITIGGTTAGTSLSFTSEGEASVKVDDVSFSSKNQFGSIRASVYKKASMSNEEMVDAIVTKLNAAEPSFITAAKVKDGGNQYFGITITPKEDDISLEVSITDMWESDTNVVSTPLVHSIGKGTDILQMEKDFSTEEGNGNYIDYTSDWYKRIMQADSSESYDLVSLIWEGRHSSPSRSHNVMINRVAIACVNGVTPDTPPASNQSTDEILALLDLILGTAYDSAAGAETLDDDGTETDGTAGN